MLKPKGKTPQKTREENKLGILTLFAGMNETLDNFFYPEEMFSSGLGTLLILGSLPFEVVNHAFCLLSGCPLQTASSLKFLIELGFANMLDVRKTQVIEA